MNLSSHASGGLKSKIKVSVGFVPSGGSEGARADIPPSSWWWPALLGLWLRHSGLCLCHLPFSSLCLRSLSFLIRTPVTGFRAHPESRMISVTSAKTLFPNQVTFIGSGS